MWDYSQDKESTPYGDTKSYELAAAWLKDCKTVEDWGCGRAYAKRYFEGQQYIGVDWAPGFADAISDIRFVRRNAVDGILMRHVIEHTYDWMQTLVNALRTSRKLSLVIFTPFNEVETEQISWNEKEGCPDLSFCLGDITSCFSAVRKTWTSEAIRSNTQYGSEHLFYVG